MEDNKLMRKELASGARLALIFGIMNTLLNSLVSAIFAAPDAETAARTLRETVRKELGV